MNEKKWAVPFISCTAGLFILGGLFGYFVALPSGLAFLFGASGATHVVSKITIENYFDRFVDAMLGIGVVFEIPVLFFFLTLIRVVSPAFLLKHSRYAILIIVTIAAIVTPTTDAFNLTLFSLPMCLLFFLGVFASYLLVLKRESRRFPWKAFLKWLAIALFVAGCAVVILLQSIVCSGGENQLRVVPWNRSSLAPEFHVHQSACQREESVPAAARPQPRGLAPVGGGSV